MVLVLDAQNYLHSILIELYVTKLICLEIPKVKYLKGCLK